MFKYHEYNALNQLINIKSGIVNISGCSGCGKTSLINDYLYKIKDTNSYINLISFPNEMFVKLLGGGYGKPPLASDMISYFFENRVSLTKGIPNIIILDSYIDQFRDSSDIVKIIIDFYKKSNNDMIIIYTTEKPQPPSKDITNIIIPFIPFDIVYNFLRMEFPNISDNMIENIYSIAKNDKSLLQQYYYLLRNTPSANNIVFNEGIIGSDGRPLKDKKSTLIKVSEISHELLINLSNNPKLLYNLSPYEFERVIAALFEKKGFSVTITPQTRDGGKDIFIAQDNIASFLFYVECKKYQPNNHVGIEIIQRLYGVVAAEKATAGIIATTSYFTKPAIDYVKIHNLEHQLSLKDFNSIRNLLNELIKN